MVFTGLLGVYLAAAGRPHCGTWARWDFCMPQIFIGCLESFGAVARLVTGERWRFGTPLVVGVGCSIIEQNFVLCAPDPHRDEW